MEHYEPAKRAELGPDVIVISRRSFFGALLGLGTAAMGTLLAVPVLRFVLYPLYAKNKGAWWSKLSPLRQLPPTGGPPVRKTITFDQRDGWREVVTSEAVYVEQLPDQESLVLSSICPHLGCTVSWQGDKDQFYCPCHGSVFNREGKRVSGPTPRGMDPLSTKTEDGDLLVHFEYFRPNVPNRESLG